MAYSKVSLAPVELVVSWEMMLISGWPASIPGGVPEVTEPCGPRKRKILPVTIQEGPTLSESEALPLPLSSRPATRISKVWEAPSQSRGSQGVTSISVSVRSNASRPTSGRHSPGTIPPVNMTVGGTKAPAIWPSMRSSTSRYGEYP